jgi:hypothetical protein
MANNLAVEYPDNIYSYIRFLYLPWEQQIEFINDFSLVNDRREHLLLNISFLLVLVSFFAFFLLSEYSFGLSLRFVTIC